MPELFADDLKRMRKEVLGINPPIAYMEVLFISESDPRNTINMVLPVELDDIPQGFLDWPNDDHSKAFYEKYFSREFQLPLTVHAIRRLNRREAQQALEREYDALPWWKKLVTRRPRHGG